jgi:hypothetical protein
MLKALLLSLTTLALAAIATAQNLVPNPSFEDTTNCHLPEGQYEFMLGLARPWFSANAATPDVYSGNPVVACGTNTIQEGLMNAHDGLRYAGAYMYTNSSTSGGTKEYMAVRLSQDLVAGNVYRLSMYLARSSFSRFSVDTIGAYFSPDSLYEDSYARLQVVPQVRFGAEGHFTSMEWIEVMGFYTAEGGERYLYIGSFEEDADMSSAYDPFFGGVDLGYYNVDKVELVTIDVAVPDVSGGDGSLYIFRGTLYWPDHHIAKVTFFNVVGGKVVDTVYGDGRGVIELPVDIAHGVYVLLVHGAEGTKAIKWVKE